MGLELFNYDSIEYYSSSAQFFDSLLPKDSTGADDTAVVSALKLISATSCSLWCDNKDGWGPITEYFDLSLCFINGALFSFVNLLFILYASHKLWTMGLVDVKYRKNWSYYARLLLVGIQIVLSIGSAVIVGGRGELKDVIFLQPIVQIAALVFAYFLHYFDYLYEDIPLGGLLFYWLTLSYIGLLRVVHLGIRHQIDNYFILSLFGSISSLFSLLVEWCTGKTALHFDASAAKVSPYDRADSFSILTFSWMSPLMRTGYKHFLTEEDIPALPRTFRSKYLSQTFGEEWQKQIDSSSKPSLGWTLAKTYGPTMLVAGVFKAFQDILQFSQPQLLKILIKFVNTYNSDVPQPLVKGFMIALTMFTFSIFQTGFLQQYFLRAFNVGINISGALTTTIYQKSLNLSNEAKGAKATGDIVNLMSVDVRRLQDCTQNVTIIWSGPFQLILCLVSLYNLLGNSMWVGVFIMLILIPLNAFIVKYVKTLQKAQMKYKDERTRITSEILNNIKSLKLYGWEKPYKEKLNDVRNNKELRNLKKTAVVLALANFLFNIAPFLVSCSTFAVFVLTQDKPLSTDLVFPALALFNLLSFPLAMIPMAITSFIEASVAVGRIRSFLTSGEVQPDAVIHLPPARTIGQTAVKVDNGTFLWQRHPEYKVALKGLNITAKKGQLTCIVGKVGSGKSAVIQSILGDLECVDGSVTIHGNVAYVAQIPWIMNGSVKENILFGHKYDPVFYEKTIKACALTVDLKILADGDETLVGEKGISLSGGQKARLSLARAVYARADVYLLDDPLAAVDEHVGNHLVQHVLGPNGLLSTKTKILATNKISVLSIANSITLVSKGAVIEQGTYEEVNKPGTALSQLIKEFGSRKEDDAVKEEEVNTDDLVSSDESVSNADATSLRRASDEVLIPLKFDEDVKESRKEHREQGRVKWNVYIQYAKACNPKHVLLFIFFVILSMALSVLGNVWLKHWSEVNSRVGYNPDVAKYLGIYLLFGVGSALASLTQTMIVWILCSIAGSKILHEQMIDSVLRAPMRFFETTPTGRIINRFSSDIFKIDEILPRTFMALFSTTTRVLFTIIVICFSTWQFIFIIFPLMILYSYYQQYYLRTSRELRRLESTTRSPIFAHFQETLGGVSTIRGFGQQERFKFINESRVDNNLSTLFPSITSNRWLAVRLEFLGSLMILSASGLCIITLKYGKMTAGLVGLSISYALQVTQALNWIVRTTVDIESNIVSVERVKEYSELKPEAAEIVEPRPPTNWPSKGEIVFKDYSTRYREDLGLVLKGINLDIKPKQKIGIVGRTGAGKSSLTLALYRIIEAAGGEIDIDGIPIADIGLDDLRHRLSIIPQDSQVFEGTVRENIDPTNRYTDEQIWNALELSHLKDHILGMSKENEGLNVKLSEGGSNLSVGQRQLMCLARALLIPSTILVLDEATAAVDVETDKVLQETIRKEFKNRTILTIAHRLNTIMDSDKIVVLDKGQVAEFDTPQNLLKIKDGLFYSLVNAE